jgi:hypothetical protein
MNNPPQDQSVLLWYPIGVASLIASVALVAGATLEVRVKWQSEDVRESLRLVRELNEKLYGNRKEEDDASQNGAGK